MAGKQVVIDEVRREQFVLRLQVSLGLRLQEAAHQGHVLNFGRHGVCSLLPSCAMKPSSTTSEPRSSSWARGKARRIFDLPASTLIANSFQLTAFSQQLSAQKLP